MLKRFFFNVEDDPDEVEYEGYMGNHGPLLEVWYHKAFLLVWPKKIIKIACKVGVPTALERKKRKKRLDEADFYVALQDFLIYSNLCNASTVWPDRSNHDQYTPRLLRLCLSRSRARVARCTIHLLSCCCPRVFKAIQYCQQGWDLEDWHERWKCSKSSCIFFWSGSFYVKHLFQSFCRCVLLGKSINLLFSLWNSYVLNTKMLLPSWQRKRLTFLVHLLLKIDSTTICTVARFLFSLKE